MPGQIKIDDGAGNYTVLTNGGSLGSDKTITIPNTTGTMALTSDISAGGVTEYGFRSEFLPMVSPFFLVPMRNQKYYR